MIYINILDLSKYTRDVDYILHEMREMCPIYTLGTPVKRKRRALIKILNNDIEIKVNEKYDEIILGGLGVEKLTNYKYSYIPVDISSLKGKLEEDRVLILSPND